MTIIAKFVLDSKDKAGKVNEFIRGLSFDSPIEIIVKHFKKKRTNQQNSTYWARLTDIAEQVEFDGRHFLPEDWHIYCKRKFLPERCEKGIEKWKYLPFGDDRILNMSTTDLNTAEFFEYRLQVEAFGAEMGVKFYTRQEIPGLVGS